MDHANQAAVGIIGLGIMGSALADQLISKRFSVFGFDPDPKARKRASRSGVQVVSSVELLLSHSQQLLSSLPSSDAFEASCEALIEPTQHPKQHTRHRLCSPKPAPCQSASNSANNDGLQLPVLRFLIALYPGPERKHALVMSLFTQAGPKRPSAA